MCHLVIIGHKSVSLGLRQPLGAILDSAYPLPPLSQAALFPNLVACEVGRSLWPPGEYQWYSLFACPEAASLASWPSSIPSSAAILVCAFPVSPRRCLFSSLSPLVHFLHFF